MEISRVVNELNRKLQSKLQDKQNPVSAKVSIKCSYVKYQLVKEETHQSEFGKKEEKPNSDLEKLSSDVKRLQKEKDNLEKVLQQERSRVTFLEVEVGEARDKILKAKKEKNSLNTSLKTYKSELDNIRVEEMKIEKVIDQVKLKNQG